MKERCLIKALTDLVAMEVRNKCESFAMYLSLSFHRMSFPSISILTPRLFTVSLSLSLQVNVIGDGHSEVTTLAGDKLSNLESIMKAGENIALPAPVEKTGKTLSKKIFE